MFNPFKSKEKASQKVKLDVATREKLNTIDSQQTPNLELDEIVEKLILMINAKKNSEALKTALYYLENSYPGSEKILNIVAGVHIKMGSFDTAIKYLEQAFQYGAENDYIAHNLGYAHFMLSNYKKAAAYFNRAISYDTNTNVTSQSYYYLALIEIKNEPKISSVGVDLLRKALEIQQTLKTKSKHYKEMITLLDARLGSSIS